MRQRRAGASMAPARMSIGGRARRLARRLPRRFAGAPAVLGLLAAAAIPLLGSTGTHGAEAAGAPAAFRVVDAPARAQALASGPLVPEGRLLTGGPEELERRGEQTVAHGQLGYSVAMSSDGSTAVVGAPDDDGGAGAAWIFTRVAGGYAQQGPKLSDGEAAGDGGAGCVEEGGGEGAGCSFGRSVAISGDGNTVLVGAPRQSGPCGPSGEQTCAYQGAVWVFTRSGGAWTHVATLSGGPEEGPEGRFGRSVALSASGTTAVVGASADHGGRGSAWVFEGAGASWSQVGPALGGGEERGEGHLGGAVAVSGDGTTVLAGGPGDAGYVGAAWLYARSGAQYVQLGPKLTGAGESGAGHFGAAVALTQDGATALVGARRDAAGAGAAWVFARAGEGFAAQGPKLTSGAPEGEEVALGYSVALSADGDRALLGAPREGANTGAVLLFERSGGSWSQLGAALHGGSEAAPRHGFLGASVALRADGGAALVGAPSEGADAGAVWAFAEPSALPAVEQLSPEAGPTSGGTAVTISGERLGGASAVSFGSQPASSFSATGGGTVTAVAPPEPAGGACVTVTTQQGTSPPCVEFTYLAPPVVTALEPRSGPTSGGTAVTIEGSGFLTATGTSAVAAVDFGSIPATAFSVGADGVLTAVAPAEHEGEVDVRVLTPGGLSGVSPADGFTFVPGGSPTSAAASAAVLGFGPARAGGPCAAGLLSRRLAVSARSRASVQLLWRGGGRCRGKVRLALVLGRGRHRRTKTVATGIFNLASGHEHTIAIALDSFARRRLAAGHGALGANLLIVSQVPGPPHSATAAVTLRVQRGHAHRRG